MLKLVALPNQQLHCFWQHITIRQLQLQDCPSKIRVLGTNGKWKRIRNMLLDRESAHRPQSKKRQSGTSIEMIKINANDTDDSDFSTVNFCVVKKICLSYETPWDVTTVVSICFRAVSEDLCQYATISA